MVSARGVLRVGFDCHVVGHRQTGNERYAVELARALAAIPEVEVTAYLDQGAEWPATATDPAAAVRHLRRLRLGNRWLRIPFELPYRTGRDRVDLLHVQYVPPPFAPVPVVTMVADLSFHDRPDLLPAGSRARLRLTTRLATARSKAIVVPSAFTRERFLLHYDIDPARVHVTPEGVSPRWRTDGGGPDAGGPDAGGPDALLGGGADPATAALPADLPAHFVLAVGALHPRKNLPLIVEAVDRARRAGAGDLGLVLAGPDGPGAAALEGMIADRVAGPWVRRLGYVSDRTMAALYGRATAVAFASLYEGFGLPVLEAMAAGAAVVASNTTSIPEVAGDAALLVDPTDAMAVADAIGRIASDEALRARLGAAGRERARIFSWERSAEATLRAYRAALGS